MARPVRILKSDTCYVVSHRLAGGMHAFSGQLTQSLFLNILAELPKRFHCLIHAYRLEPAQYFIYLKTKLANLDAMMRHLNGIFTERYQKAFYFKGRIFEKRYRAVVVEPARYRQALLYHLHRDTLPSSQAYYQTDDFPHWLSRLELNPDENVATRLNEVTAFFKKQRWSPILGSLSFQRQLLRGNFHRTQSLEKKPALTVEYIINTVASHFNVDPPSVLASQVGRGRGNLTRACAVYLCRNYAGFSLREIAAAFDLQHPASASALAGRFQKVLKKDGLLQKKLERLIASLI